MPKVTVLPNAKICPQGAVVEVPTGAKLAQALVKAGVEIPHACEYNCACATCHVIVRKGFDTLPEADDRELDQLDNAFGVCEESRLACQVKMGNEDITIEIPKNNRNLVGEGH